MLEMGFACTIYLKDGKNKIVFFAENKYSPYKNSAREHKYAFEKLVKFKEYIELKLLKCEIVL
jgi:hypothetical protein